MNIKESLKDRTIIITGASRGIGREMALRFAADGANIVIAAKSTEPHPKLPGTIFTVADEVREAGGQALAVQVDVRDEAQIKSMVDQAVEAFGGIDGLVNNAGAIKLATAESLPLKRFDLMYQINTRAVLACAQACLPHLKKSRCGHILNLSPPVNLDHKWFENFGPYTITKYGMSMLTVSMAAEFKRYGIAVNSLWPQTLIATAAVEFEAGGKAALEKARKPAIMADAAYAIMSVPHCSLTGQWLIDETYLRSEGRDNFDDYRYDDSYDGKLMKDLFLD
ncbi:SDR family oxidoreductase [Allohahella sp. A8]|uniref:SDR family oxidoreductase n=1 Tax=Allohahella sp. A8 TaxID=3141461 RepID=UPI000C0BA572|nr:short chain dehydrogenase [Hahellaceae bacterium]|tara:strand:- start:70031 stop:70870 length:840 start_codon:yes stop_codon:yes gene_type:complete